MVTLSPSRARASLYSLIEKAAKNHEVIPISGKRGDVVLMSREDLESLEETLYILSQPKLMKQIRRGAKEPIRKGFVWRRSPA